LLWSISQHFSADPIVRPTKRATEAPCDSRLLPSLRFSPDSRGRVQPLQLLRTSGMLDTIAPSADASTVPSSSLFLALAEFRTLGIDFVSSQEALDTSTPMGKAMFTIIGAMAEFERNVIRERVVAGLEHARNHGTKSGAAIGRPRSVFDRARVAELRAAGRSWRQIATGLSVSVRSARRVHARGVAKPSSRETEIGGAAKRVVGA